ncbi:hypothetical protein AB0I22_34830 [Streptomyces sp. NPDC050610]|uniref:hypothetical protein n=1 Tax=Streptomyces sp. NPDC050610 TaxID=3157097 RepID=UPI003442515A
MGHGKFDGESHEQLYSMISGAKPSLFSDAEAALNKAHTDISAIGEEFKAHVERVKWEGEGADSFRAWGAEMAKQTLVMAEYTKGVGKWIGHAGKGLSAGQSEMPPVADMCYVDPEKDAKRRLDSNKKLDEAIKAMEKADSYVTVAQEGLEGLKEPNFPLLPTDLGAPDVGGYERPLGAPPSGGSTAGGGATSHTVSLPYAADTGGGADPVPGHLSHHGGTDGVRHLVETDRQGNETADTTIDSTTTSPSPDTTNHTMPDHGARPSGTSSATSPFVPGPLPPNMPSSSRGAGKFASGRVSGFPEGSVNSSPRTVAVPRVGANDGVVGGTPADRSARPTGPRLPRGTVVGEERGLMSGAPMRRAPTGVGGYGAGSGQSGAAADIPGRRPASEPGGSTGRPRASREGRPEFTQGGSGLVRGNHATEAMPPRSGTKSPGKGSRRAGVRPDYLTEDEETWQRGRRDPVPPVID